MKGKMILGVLFGAMAVGGCTSTDNTKNGALADLPPLYRETGNIYSFRTGQAEIYMLVESSRSGNSGILVNGAEAIEKYIPESGFNHSTNAFLVKIGGKNILVDTAFGGAVFESMQKLGVTPEQIDAVLITHLHGDHIGGLQKDGEAVFPNASIYLSQRELTYFTETNVNQGAVAALAPYKGRIVSFEPPELRGTLNAILPGIFPIANYGHTPGHTIYLIEDGGEKCLIIGDLLHVALVQFPVPEISATYDMDQGAAAAARRQVLDFAAKNKITIGGMHMVYPAAGTVEAEASGFKFIPGK